jgi:hypothetical protein
MEAVRFDADDYAQFLYSAGFDSSLEWTPLRFPRAIRAGSELAVQNTVEVVHESWRELTLDAIARLAVRDMRALKEELEVAVGFPLLDESYGQLWKMEEEAHRFMPIIVHPEGQWLGGREPSRPRQSFPNRMFGAVWYQPTAEWAANNGIRPDLPVDELVDQIIWKQTESGLDGAVLDFAHLLAERAGHQFNDVPGLVAALIKRGVVREIQLTFRPDFGGKQGALDAAVNGRLVQTKQGELLQVVRNNWPTGAGPIRIVGEERASRVRKAHSSKSHVEGHKQINASVREIMGSRAA